MPEKIQEETAAKETDLKNEKPIQKADIFIDDLFGPETKQIVLTYKEKQEQQKKKMPLRNNAKQTKLYQVNIIGEDDNSHTRQIYEPGKKGELLLNAKLDEQQDQIDTMENGKSLEMVDVEHDELMDIAPG